MDTCMPASGDALTSNLLWIAIPPGGRAPVAVCSASRLDLDRLLHAAGLEPNDCTIGRGRLAEAEFILDWDRTSHRVFV